MSRHLSVNLLEPLSLQQYQARRRRRQRASEAERAQLAALEVQQARNEATAAAAAASALAAAQQRPAAMEWQRARHLHQLTQQVTPSTSESRAWLESDSLSA